MDSSLEKLYGNKVRTRVCGICSDAQGRLLVANMKGITSSIEQNQSFFAPIGGGVELGETATDALKREFLEETGLKINIDYFMCVYEHIDLPIHAIELFFAVRAVGGKLKTGTDPELENQQIIRSIDYLEYSKILELPILQRHGIFKYASSLDNIKKLRGYIRAT